MCLELVARAIDDESISAPTEDTGSILAADLAKAGSATKAASMAGSTSVSTGAVRQNCWNITPIRRPRFSRRRCFNGPGSKQAIERRIIPAHADQFNSIHERLIEAWQKLGAGRHLHLAGNDRKPEDAGTLAYLEDTARQAGLATTLIDIEDIGWRVDGGFVDLDDRPIELAFKLYPWEWMFHDAFGEQLAKASTRWIEPPWKAILSNKGILPLLWEMFPDHPNLLPAYFEDDPNAARLGASFVRKPLYSREGANVALVSEGVTVAEQARAVRRRRFCSPGPGAAAELFRTNIRWLEAG